MDLIELAAEKADERKRKTMRELEEQQFLKNLRNAEVAPLVERRIKAGIPSHSYIAKALGVSSARIKRLELGETVKDRKLLLNAYDYFLSYMEENSINIGLRKEFRDIQSVLSRNTVILELNGQRFELPIMSDRRKRSVI